MHSALHQSFSSATLVQLGTELLWMFVVILLVLRPDDHHAWTQLSLVTIALLVAMLMIAMNGAFGLYRRSANLSPGDYLLRAILALMIGIPLAMLVTHALPGGEPLQRSLAFGVLVAVVGLLLIRHFIVLPVVAKLVPHRVMVLGTGPEARLVEASMAAGNPLGVHLVGFYALDKVDQHVVSPNRVIARGASLEETVRQLGIDEIIVAVREQRGGVLPLRELLDCRLHGVQVTDLARYFERVHGQVPIESLKVSWLIYGNGFRQTLHRNVVKRTFDVVASLFLLVLASPLILLAAAAVFCDGGAPIIYRQTRVGFRGKLFTVLKFRTMGRDAEEDGKPAWAAINDSRVTRVGRILRRSRIDELPQLVNVFRGEMSFVGPRPERPEFVAMLTEQIPFYAVRQSVKPGITGWAQVRYSYGATIEQTSRKLEYDLFYVKNHTLLFDLAILLETVRVVLLGEGAR